MTRGAVIWVDLTDAVVPGIRQLKKSRILGAAGHLKAADLKILDEALRAYLSD